MQQSTSQNKVFGPSNDPMREAMFFKAYGKKARIFVTNVLDGENDWVSSTIDFKDSSKTYSMIERFHPKSNGKTDCVRLIGEGIDKTFNRCLEAELTVVELLNG